MASLRTYRTCRTRCTHCTRCTRRSGFRQLRGRLRAEALQLGRHAIDGMAAEVEAERLLFVRELLHFGPRLDVRRAHRRLVGSPFIL